MAKIQTDDTIAAIATPVGEGGISIIRISGQGALKAAAGIFHPASGSLEQFASHTVHYGHILDKNGQPVDQVLVTLFRNPKSYTGEDTVEISSHGGLAVTRKILELVFRAGARPAEPGEFTRRAFLNGRIDLTQAEAVIDLIRARSDLSVRVALRQLEGALSVRFRKLRDRLMKVYAHMEAYVDFPEEDIEVYSDAAFGNAFEEVESEITGLIDSFRRGSVLREGVRCVIAGKPNAGKSSLFNALLERDRALVSEYEGTTRDMLEESAEIGGVLVRLTDTAGLGHDSENPLDRIGMERTRQVLRAADLVLFIADGSKPLEARDEAIYREAADQKCPVLTVINKCDVPSILNEERLAGLTGSRAFIKISTVTRAGFEELEKEIERAILGGNKTMEGEQVTRLRHKNALEAALASLGRTKAAFAERRSLDLVTLDLKDAIDQLGELIGEVYSEDLLDVIFSEFCIGK